MKGQVDLKVKPLDITDLESAWRVYSAGNFTGATKVDLAAWMGARMGLVLREIRILRTQVEGLQAGMKDEQQKRQEDTFDHMMDMYKE